MSAQPPADAAGGRGDARASTRVRKASAAMSYADAETRQAAAAARLEALENDNAAAEGGGDDSDDYVLADDIEGARFTARRAVEARSETHSPLIQGRGRLGGSASGAPSAPRAAPWRSARAQSP